MATLEDAFKGAATVALGVLALGGGVIGINELVQNAYRRSFDPSHETIYTRTVDLYEHATEQVNATLVDLRDSYVGVPRR